MNLIKKIARYYVLPTVVGVAGLTAIKLNVDNIFISTVFNVLGTYLIITAYELFKQD